MFTMTNDFDTKMMANLRPAMSVRIEYGQIDVNARNTAEMGTSSTETYFSNSEQTLGDRRRIENYPIGTLEQNEFLLDGSFNFSPSDDLEDNKEIGFRAEQVGDETGAMNVSYKVTTAENINAFGLSILFSKLLEQYAVDFNISFGETTHEIRDNNKVYWVGDFEVNGVTEITVTILKWCKPNTRAKITQFEFGRYIDFDNETLTSVDVNNKFSPVSDKLSESSCSFSFVNLGQSYNPMALGGQEKFIEDRQPITVYVGYPGEEYIIGYYELDGNPLVSNSEVSVKAVSLINRFNQEIKETTYTNKSLFYIAEKLFDKCGIVYKQIDESLKSISVTATVEGKCRDILTDLAIAGRCQVWQEEDTLILGKMETVTDYCISEDVAQSPIIEIDDKIKSITVVKGETEYLLEIPEVDRGTELVIKDNPFIKNQAQANNILNWLKDYYTNRQIIKVDWRQNPALTVGEVVKVDTDFGQFSMRVEENTLSMAGGGLHGNTSGRMVVTSN